ncbi:ABC transporter permease [Streptococcus halichoeri]|uniref:ABC transporter permease n=1 Tax=Streptococcus halichoeri TaxID=254785 RepID=UPI00135B07B8|nr:ABC transporter permease [Streptococcus halichoeri]
MLALLKIEWIKTWREWPTFILGIGMPVVFFLFYSGMTMFADPVQQKTFVQSYMLTMTAFSMSSFGFFSFPFMLVEDQTNHWLTYLEHSRVTMWQYYLAKVFRVLLNFACSITITFLVAALCRDVHLLATRWLGSILLLLLSGLLFLAFGLLIAQVKSQQLMSIVGNIAFLGFAIIGGSWMPIATFPDWLQAISKWTPLYHVNQLLVQFVQNGSFLWSSFVSIMAYAIIVAGLALVIKGKMEVT